MPILTRMLCLCLALMNLVLSVLLPSSSFVTMAVSRPHCVVKSDRWSPENNRLREDYYYEAVAFSRHSINLKLNKEIVKPEKATKAPRNAGIDPSTMKMKQWYQRHNRVSDKKAPTGTDRASYEAREHDDGRLAMRQSEMPPQEPERVTNPRIREDRAVQDVQLHSERMHRATSEDTYRRAWFDYCRSVFPQSVRKAGLNVDLHNVSTYQCSILFNNMGSFNRKSEFRKSENMDKLASPHEKFNVTNDPQLSQRILVKQLRACDLDGRG